jgi:hypothetical protein
VLRSPLSCGYVWTRSMELGESRRRVAEIVGRIMGEGPLIDPLWRDVAIAQLGWDLTRFASRDLRCSLDEQEGGTITATRWRADEE